MAVKGKTSTMVEVKATIARRSGVADKDRLLTVGQVAERAGVATSALRFYEEHELISSTRNEANHRRYRADVLRRVGFIRVAQRIGLTLSEIRAALETLPDSRTPTRRDWARLARSWQPMLDERIALMESMKSRLDGCIGCGCLSLDSCALYNSDDEALQYGVGPRWLLGNTSNG
jgi:MerR family redox-sensitive transcriptional activator SoxR